MTDFNEFKDALFNKKLIRHKMKRIQRKKHNITKQKINKISLSRFGDGIHTIAYIHKDFRK